MEITSNTKILYRGIAAIPVLCILYVILSLPAHLAKADVYASDSAFSTFCTNAVNILYLEDGRILFATREGGEVDTVECIDASEDPLWTCHIPSCDALGLVDIKQLSDGTFAISGKAANGLWQVLFISSEGEYLNRMELPENSYAPVIAPDGVFYSTFDTGEKEPDISIMDWNGNTKRVNFAEAKGFTTYRALPGQGNTYLQISYRNMNEQMTYAVVCLNESGEISWQYDVGGFEQWSMGPWSANNAGGITIQLQHRDEKEEKVYILCLDGKGRTVWRNWILCPASFQTAHVIEQAEDGNCIIWGHARINRTQDITFSLTLDSTGDFVENAFASGWGDCHKYIDGEVYATVYSDSLTPLYHTPFSTMESVQMEPFVVTKE